MRTRHPVVPDPNHDLVELVWENGTLPVRGRTNPNNDVRFSDNELVGHEEENEGRGEKTPRLGSHPSVFLFGGGHNRPNNDCTSQLYQIPTSYPPPKFNSNHHLLPTNGFSKPSKGSIDREMKKMNFSHFRGFDSLKNNSANGQGIGSTSHNRITPTKVETDNLNKKPFLGGKDMQIGSREQPIHVGTGVVVAVPPSSMAGGGDSQVPDEHSQAIGNNFIEDHSIRNSEFDDDHQVPVPDSSMGTSGAPPCKSKRSARFNQPESRYQDEDQEQEEMKGRKRRKLHHAGGSNGTKGSRSATHNLSEKKRRDRINKRMRALQELLPNCDKVDKASVLDEVIEYMKTLQLQLQIMSTGNRMFPSPMAMFPAGIHQLPLPYLNQFPLMSPGMGLRMGPGFVQGPAHQFPLPGPSSTALAGGFQPMVCMPYIPALGGHPALRSLMNGADFSRAVATMIEQLGSAATSGSNDSQKSGRN